MHRGAVLTIESTGLSWLASGSLHLTAQSHVLGATDTFDALKRIGESLVAQAPSGIFSRRPAINLVVCDSMVRHWTHRPASESGSLAELRASARLQGKKQFGIDLDWPITADWSCFSPFLCVAYPRPIIEFVMWLGTSRGYDVFLGSAFERFLSTYLKQADGKTNGDIILALGKHVYWMRLVSGVLHHLAYRPLPFFLGDDVRTWTFNELTRLQSGWAAPLLNKAGGEPLWLDLRTDELMRRTIAENSRSVATGSLSDMVDVQTRINLYLGRLQRGHLHA